MKSPNSFLTNEKPKNKMNTPKIEPKVFTEQAAALSHSLEAMRKTLIEISAAGIDFETMNKIAIVEESIRRTHTALIRCALDITVAMHNARKPIATSTDTTPDAGNENNE
jgi:hypothetical protein